MNTSSSDFSSGCESGWTTYLNQSDSSSKSRRRRSMSMKMMCGDHYREEGVNRGHGGGEDLSMVSDASSGPRQYNEEEEEEEFFDGNEYLTYRNSASEAKRKMKKKGKQRDGSQLDDTASSHSMQNWQSSMYNNTAHGHESSAACLSKGKSSPKKFFGL